MNFVLREWRKEDYKSVAAYADNIKIAVWLRDAFPYPYTEKAAEEYVKFCLAADKSKTIVRAIEINGEAAGSIGVFKQGDVYNKSAELGYWLAEKYWGAGIMTAAVKQICEEAFNILDVVRIYAEPFADNKGSRKVLEKSGFVLEGIMKQGVYKNGEYHDYCIYALLKNNSGYNA